MKRKLMLEELTVVSFATEANTLDNGKGTVRGFGDPSAVHGGTCIGSCDGAIRTCQETCVTCMFSCPASCPFTCPDNCPK